MAANNGIHRLNNQYQWPANGYYRINGGGVAGLSVINDISVSAAIFSLIQCVAA